MATEMFDNNEYHVRQPNSNAYASYDVYRSSEKDPNVTFTFYYGFTINNGMYGISNSVGFEFEVNGVSVIGYARGNGGSGNEGDPVSMTVNCPSNSAVITCYVWHHQGTNADPYGEENNCSHHYETYVWSSEEPLPAYNPYSPFSVSIDSVTSIIRPQASFNVKYTISGGTNNMTGEWVRLYNSGGTYLEDLGTGSANKGTQTVTVSSTKMSASGALYYVSIIATDGVTWLETNRLAIKTYTQPTLSGVSRSRYPQKPTQDNTFTLSGTNNRTWSENENNFTSSYTIGSRGWTQFPTPTSTSLTLSASDLRSLVPSSKDNQDVTIKFRRYNSSANWHSSEVSTTVKLIYRPQTAISASSIAYKKNNASGSAISAGAEVLNDDSLSGIYISWTYNTDDVYTGWTEGYRVQLKNSSGTVVKNYYTTNKNYTIPKADIPKMQSTSITVTPYYKNGASSAGSYWYCNTVTSKTFIKVYSKLPKTSIVFPVQNSKWIGHEFRIGFQLPKDPDYGYQTDTYEYEDIEVKVNNQIFHVATSTKSGQSSGAISLPEAFCTSTLGHENKMLVYPNINNTVTKSSSYAVKVRVKKKYISNQNLNYGWSDWGPEVSFAYNAPFSFNSSNRTYSIGSYYNVNEGDIIRNSHYNNVITVLDRMAVTYGVSWTNKPANVIANVTKIEASQYSQNNLMKILNEVKTKVNNYPTTKTRQSVLFDKNNELPITFDQKVGDIVTADKNKQVPAPTPSDPSRTLPGRNYIKYVYDRCNLFNK